MVNFRNSGSEVEASSKLNLPRVVNKVAVGVGGRPEQWRKGVADVGEATLKPRHGLAAVHVATPPVASGIVPVDWAMYAVVLTPVTFCLLARLKKSVRISILYLSVMEKLLETRRSVIHVMG